MKCCGHAYAQAFNRRHDRCGALMQGRYFSSAIGSDRHLLEVLRYIDLNPVRARLVAEPADYAWSSARFHLGRGGDAPVQPHASYESLGATSEARAAAYRDWLAAGIERDRLAAIRSHLRQGRLFGPEEFQESLARALGRPTAVRRPGRPVKAAKETACATELAQAVRKPLLTGNVPC
jgi:putative transposase